MQLLDGFDEVKSNRAGKQEDIGSGVSPQRAIMEV